MRNFLQLGKARDYIAHRRMIVFWSMLGVMLPLPWLMPACTTILTNQAHYDNCQVLSVYDGDTMTVNCQGEKIKVRLYCIDAPEMGQEPWGHRSRQSLINYAGTNITLEKKAKDKYGRIVAVILENKVNLNLRLVRSGRAVHYAHYCREKHYASAEREARQKGRGVWSQTGTHQRPWEWRSLVD